MVSYGAARFQWHYASADSYADPDMPPAASDITADEQTLYTLPKASITVIRGKTSTR